MRFLFALAAFSLTASANAIVIRHDVADSEYRSTPSDFQFLFLLYRTAEGYGDCVATLIDAQWAITAAHCTDVKKLTDGVSGGGYPVEIAGAQNFIVGIERHPGKIGDRPVDFALLKLGNAVTNARPVKVYRSRDEVGRIVLFPGWGDSGNGRDGVGKGDGIFRVAHNRVEKIEDGRLIFLFDSPESGRALALEGISGPGDSGGPALVMTPQGWATSGVSSAQRVKGEKEGLYGAEEMYVRLSDYVAWINATIRGK